MNKEIFMAAFIGLRGKKKNANPPCLGLSQSCRGQRVTFSSPFTRTREKEVKRAPSKEEEVR